MANTEEVPTRPTRGGHATSGPTLDDFWELLKMSGDLAAKHWARLPAGRAYSRPPDDLRESIEFDTLEEGGMSSEDLFARISETAVAYPLGVGHPRWWAYMASSPHPIGIAAEMVATALNNPCFPTPQVAHNFERAVIRWTAEACGVPDLTAGLLVSGGSAANFTCLAAAREAKLESIRNAGRPPTSRLRIYASSQTHFSIQKAARLLGLGANGVRTFDVDSDLRADVEDLKKAISEDRAAGLVPLAIVANAGTVMTGQVDPIDSLADVARANDCWLHVDGAYGAYAVDIPELKHRFEGIERADSLTVDAHKWLYTPYEAAAALLRDESALEAAFSNPASYTAIEDEGYYCGPAGYEHRGLQLTRAFRALKVWAIMKGLGKAELRRLRRKDIAVASEVIRLADADPRLEVVGRADLSCFCVRYVPGSGDLNAFNRKLLDRVHRDGRCFLGPALIDGSFALRGCIMNFRSTLEDARVCVETLVELGGELEASLPETPLAT